MVLTIKLNSICYHLTRLFGSDMMDPALQSQVSTNTANSPITDLIVKEKEKLWTPLHSQYEFLAAVSLATSGNESEFYSKILDFPDCSEIKPIAKRLQKMANRASVTIVSTPQTFSPESGVSKATLFFEDNTWKTVPATRKSMTRVKLVKILISNYF